MPDLFSDTKALAHNLGISTCLEFDPVKLVPEECIRGFCRDNRCGSYGGNYTCPPYVGSLEGIKGKLGRFRRGILLQYSAALDVPNDTAGVIKTKVTFHEKILQMEEFLRGKGEEGVWGLIGGSCGLCEVCLMKSSLPCPYPEKARPSLEALGINVLALLRSFGLDSLFHPDRITWTGCLLF
ncbi:MAG: DUF2284 domain-containing protein [Chloroflexota bacterium]